MKILYVSPNPTDALAFYRGTGPLSVMRKQYDVEFTIGDAVSWAQIKMHDLVYMQRPFNSQHMQVVDMCKKWGTPMIADFDDWLYGLMNDNPAYHIYEQAKPVLEHVRATAKRISVSNPYMQGLYKQLGTETTVIPNSYDSDMLTPADPEDRNRVVLWRGGNSHMQDIFSVRSGFIRLIEENPEWQFYFLNVQPWWLGRDYDNVKAFPGMGLMEYMDFIQKAKPAIMTHPLKDDPFNRSKSMCSWIEAGHAGAAFVGPDFEEFNRPGSVTYAPDDGESFYNAIQGLINNPVNIIKNAKAIQSEILGPLSTRVVNETRFKLFCE